MNATENKNEAAIRDLVDALNKGSVEGACAPIADDCVTQLMNGSEPMKGKSAYRQWIEGAFTTFKDLQNELTNVVSCGDTVVIEYIATGRLKKGSGGAEPSDRSMRLPEMNIYEFEGGRVRRIRSYFDSDLARRQLAGE